MSREILLARLSDLREQQVHALADYQAIGGAIQECEFWLSQIQSVDSSSGQTETLTLHSVKNAT